MSSLVAYLDGYYDDLDQESKRRLKTNPFRILDSKHKKMQEILSEGPDFAKYVDRDSRAHFEAFCNSLEAAGIQFTINPALVRGLDYYNRTVFEWITDALGAQGTVCGGGRYDGLVEQLCGKSTPAVGCAFGLDRLLLLINEVEFEENTSKEADVYMVAAGEAAEQMSVSCAESVRSEIKSWRVLQNIGGGSMRAQMKRADKSGATVAIIIGAEEVSSNSVTLKFLRGDAAQESIRQTNLVARLHEILIAEQT